MSIAASSRSQGRPEFVTLIAIYQFVTAGILLLMSCLIPAALFPFVVFNVDQNEGVFAGLVIGTAALALFLGFAFASVVVGWGLMGMREWARLGAIVLAAFALIGFPIWTIVAILVLVYMTSEDARFAFRPEEAPPEIRARTISTADPDAAPQAAYKAEPPDWTQPGPAEQTRRIEFGAPEPATNGAPADAAATDETRRLDTPIRMPPPQDPSEATETFYDQEADVSDHYRRWKASLPQELASTEPEAPEDVDEMTEPTEPGEPPDEPTEEDQTITIADDEATERVWGPSWAFEGARDEPVEPPVDDTEESDEVDEARQREPDTHIPGDDEPSPEPEEDEESADESKDRRD